MSAFLKKYIWHILTIAALLAWYIFFIAHPIFLTPADIGRHIKNGEQLLFSASNWPTLLNANFYSFSFPDFPFLNHHWASGVIFYLIWKGAGFLGLSIFGLIIGSAALLLSFDIARRQTNFYLAAALAWLIIPLIAERTEIRPEMFSYWFALLDLWILTRWRRGELSTRALYLLPLIQLIWINLHIYFFVGFMIIGAFWLEACLTKPRPPGKLRLLTIVGALMIAASLINPAHYRGLLYPLRIFGNYRFQVQENQSVAALSQASPGYVNLRVFKIIAAGFIILFGTALWRRRQNIDWPLVMITIIFGWLAWRGVRNFTIFGLVALPAIAELIYLFITSGGAAPGAVRWKRAYLALGAGAVLFGLILNWPRFADLWKTRGLGLMPGTEALAKFIEDNNISGPLFNDFDTGSYVEFYLFPRVRPFVDNRPEAFPASFFTETYVPLHTNSETWKKTDERYGFNAVLYSFDAKAPFALPFIINRLLDNAWAPVYTDQFAILFLKRNQQNANLIKKYEIPRERFSLRPSN